MDSKKLEHGCRMICAAFASLSLPCRWSTVVIQPSGFSVRGNCANPSDPHKRFCFVGVTMAKKVTSAGPGRDCQSSEPVGKMFVSLYVSNKKKNSRSRSLSLSLSHSLYVC